MKEIVDQLISEGREFLSKNEYKEALKIFILIKQYKGFLHAYYYYEGFTYLCWGEYTNNITEQQTLYPKAISSLRQAALYTSSKPKDTDFLLGKAFWKAGKLSEAGTVLIKYTPCPEHKEEFQRILSQIPPEPNKTTNSPLLPRENDLSSKVSKSNNNEELAKSVVMLASRVTTLEHKVTDIELTIADMKKMLASANISLIADINNQIKELQVLNPKLEEYYKHFNMALHNVCIAASAVSSGLVVPDSGHLERISASSWVKWVCYLGDIAASGFLSPIATALIAVLHDAGDNILNSKEEKKLVDVLTKFCKMINKQSNMTVSIEQDLQRLALFFANLRSAEIKKTNGTDFSNFFTTKLPLQGNFFRYDTNNTDEMNSNPMEKLALQDAISLIGYMYHNAENILKNSKSLLNQIITTAKEGLSTSWEEIRKTTPGTVENDLWQMEKQIPESEIITEKAKSGQLKSVDISYFSLDLSKPLFQKLVISSTGIRRGIEYFFNKNFTDKFTEEEQGCFALFLAYKIFRYGNEKCLAYFGEQQPELITKIFNDYPHLFFRREAINTCIKNEDDRQKALDAIKLTSSDKFFIGCFDKVFSKVDVVVDLRVAEEFKPVPAPEVVLDLLTLPLNMDENYDVLPIGIVEDNTTKL